MGIFTGNTLSSISGVDYSDLPALEGYDATVGCATAMLEAQQNDMALFNAAIIEDFKEVAAVNEGVEVLNESAKDVLLKVKEIFMKLLQKIKGIFQAFLAKLAGTFSSSESLYKKYEMQIAKYNNWKNFKVKAFRECKTDVLKKIESVGTYDANSFVYSIDGNSKNEFKDIKDFDKEEIIERLVSVRLNRELASEVDSDLKNMNEAFMNTVFEDSDSKDEWTVSEIISGNIGSLLKKGAGDKFKANIEKANTSLTTTMNKIIKELDKESVKIHDASGKANADKTPRKGYSTTAVSMDSSNNGKYNKYKASKIDIGNTITDTKELEALSKVIGDIQRIATIEQTLILSFTAARINTVKFAIAQARKVWSSAAAYSSTEHKNEGYEFYTAIGEATAYDFMTDIEAITA